MGDEEAFKISTLRCSEGRIYRSRSKENETPSLLFLGPTILIDVVQGPPAAISRRIKIRKGRGTVTSGVS